MPHDKAVAIITEGRGSHFDPDIVDAFLGITSQFHEVSLHYADSDQDLARKAEALKVITG
jgi:putative two-component system response regulator